MQSLRIRLPGGLLIEEGNDVESVIVDREKDLLTDVIVYFGDETAEKAVDRALAMAKRYGLDDQGTLGRFLSEARELRSKGPDESSAQNGGAEYPDARRLRLDEPSLSVRILQAGGDKPWNVHLELHWHMGGSEQWDLSAGHTVAAVGNPFPANGSTEGSVPNTTSLRIVLPGGREFRAGGTNGDIRLTRSGDTVTMIHTLFGEPSPEEAHKRAAALAGEWGAAGALSMPGWPT